jgi:hypothetical protein
MARHNTDKLEKWLDEHKLIGKKSIKYLGLYVEFNDKWSKHIAEKMEKMKGAYRGIKLQGVAMDQIDSISNIHLIKSLVVTVGTYGCELMNLGKQEQKQVDKELAKIYKDVLGLEYSAPTKWVLWEVDQESIAEKMMKAKLNYWKKTIVNGNNGLHYEIINWEGSYFNRRLEETRRTLNIGRGWDILSEAKWKDHIKTAINKHKKLKMENIEYGTNNMNFIKIKPGYEMVNKILNISGKGGRMVLQMRAQTVGIQSDYHRNLITQSKCSLCKLGENSLEHIIFSCSEMKQEREKLTEEILKHVTADDMKTMVGKNNIEFLQAILGLYITKQTDNNIKIMVQLGGYMAKWSEKIKK